MGLTKLFSKRIVSNYNTFLASTEIPFCYNIQECSLRKGFDVDGMMHL